MNYGNLFDAQRAVAAPQYGKRHQPLAEAVRESHVQ